MTWKFNLEQYEDASLYLADDPVKNLVKRAEKETGAGRPEVLLAMLFEVEDLAHRCGLPGPEFLFAAASNRRKVRGEIGAAKQMSAALDEILRQHRSKDQ